MNVHQIDLQPDLGGFKVNSWLLEGERLSLIDAGYKTQYCEALLRQKLHVLGYRVEDIQSLFITHPHVDHQGLASLLQKTGAQIYIPESAANRLFEYPEVMAQNRNWLEKLAKTSGVPLNFIHSMINREEQTAAFAEGIQKNDSVHLLASKSSVFLGDETFTVYETPGHSSSHQVLHGEQSGILFSGDLILETAPTSLILDGGCAGVSSLLSSHEIIRSLQITRVFPGHGFPMESAKLMMEKRESLTRYRLLKIQKLLVRGSKSAYEIARELTRKLDQLFLVYFFETYAHLLYAKEMGLIQDEAGNDGIVQWSMKARSTGF